MFKILVAEDDANIRRLIAKNLINNGYQVFECNDGRDAVRVFDKEHIDLVITDIMMPILDGYGLIKYIRNINKDIPTLMITALESYDDKEKGFDSGIDDYIVKPVDMKELLLRIKALLRRYKIVSDSRLELKSTVLDYNAKSLLIRGEEVELTKKEFLLLFKFLATPNIIFTREQLMNEIWGYDSESDDRTIDTHIKRLREKVQSDDFEIITVRGLGYKGILK